jgi:hypothetical protein
MIAIKCRFIAPIIRQVDSAASLLNAHSGVTAQASKLKEATVKEPPVKLET